MSKLKKDDAQTWGDVHLTRRVNDDAEWAAQGTLGSTAKVRRAQAKRIQDASAARLAELANAPRETRHVTIKRRWGSTINQVATVIKIPLNGTNYSQTPTVYRTAGSRAEQ